MKVKNIFFTIAVLCISHLKAFQSTRLNFVIEHEVLSKNDYVEVKLQVKTNNKILSEALAHVQQIIAFIIQKSSAFCLQNSKKQEDCQEISQIKKERVNPLYKANKNQLILQTFDVKRQVILKVKSVKNIGVLVDQLIAGGEEITLTSFDWKSKNKYQDQVLAMNQGVQEGKRLCRQLGEQLKSIISIQEVAEFQETDVQEIQQQQEAEQILEIQEQEENFHQKQFVILKFQVQCQRKVKK